MQQPSTSTGAQWRSANDYFKTPDHAVDEDRLIYRSINSMYPKWFDRAECRTTEKSVFFGSSSPEERPAYTLSSIRRARAMCASCPVFNECLSQAIHNREVFGLWAGTTMRQRKSFFKQIDAGVITAEEVYSMLMRRSHD